MECKMRDTCKCHHRLVSLLLLFLSMILLQSTCPASLYAMDLMEAYSRARGHDALFGVAFYEHEAARTLPKQGRAILFPTIQARGSAARINYDSAPAFYRDYTSKSMSVNLQQPLFSLPRYHEYRQYKIRGNIGEVRFVSAEQDLLFRVSEAYFNVLAAGNLLDLIDVEKKAIEEQGVQARRMFEAGVTTITDVHDAEARLDDVLAGEIEAKNDLDFQIEAFKKIVGTEPARLDFLKEEVPFGIPGPENLDAWIEIAKEYHPILKGHAYQIDYQEAELKKNQGQHWPNVDLVAGYYRTNTSDNRETAQISYGTGGVQINLPIYSGGYTAAKVSESRAVLSQARKEYENALAEITQKLSEALLGIRGNMARIDALLVANKSAYTSVISNRKSLLAGVRTTIDVLNAERDLQDVRVRLLQARYDCLMNMLKLKASAGTFSGEDLLRINSWLQTADAN